MGCSNMRMNKKIHALAEYANINIFLFIKNTSKKKALMMLKIILGW